MWWLHRYTAVLLLMVVHDFDVDSFSVVPFEADPITVVDPDTVLADAFLPKSLKLKAGAL
jgi:hypothetical protein